MQVLIAVVYDLFQFVCKAFSGAVPYVPQQVKLLDTYQEKLQQIQNSAPATITVPEVTVPKTAQTEDILRIGDQYFIGVIGTYLYHDPAQAFDNALQRLEYGQHIRLVSVRGRWAHVRFGNTQGWVFKDALVMQADEVYPKFVQGIQYDANHVQTVKLRACIDDLFGGARGEHPLSAAEYVHYRLVKKKRFIDWGSIRLRIPGTWQPKLGGQRGIHIGIAPKTESVMEYVVDDIGHLAFVEAVFPDDSMKISEIGKMDDCAYTEEILQSEQWRESRPVFIEVE
jgi:hypothetical protein